VKYTKHDQDQLDGAATACNQTSGNCKPAFRLGLWNGSQWVLFAQKKHNYRIVSNNPSETSGFETVDIFDWGDPFITHRP
jgi:hypothetical protein